MSKRKMESIIASYSGNLRNEERINLEQKSYNPGGEVTMCMARNPDRTPQIFHTCILECEKEEDRFQCCAWYLSAVCSLYPGLFPIAKGYLNEMGYRVTVVDEDGLTTLMVELAAWLDNAKIFAMAGQIMLLLYKNIDDKSYQQWMRRRAIALGGKSTHGQGLLDDGSEIIFTIETARTISTTAGGCPDIRSAVLKYLLNNRQKTTVAGRVYNYVTEMVAWTEMASMVFIMDVLCLTNSPVLQDPRVKREVYHLADTYTKVMTTEFPQYYKIFHPVEAEPLLIRSRFETLIEVARQVRAKEKGTIQQFAQGSSMQKDTLVGQLVSMHEAHMAGQVPNHSHYSFKFLTDFDRTELQIEEERLQRQQEADAARQAAQAGQHNTGGNP